MRTSGTPGWNQDFSYALSRQYDYILAINGLPLNKTDCYITNFFLRFNDLSISIIPDSNGTYTFMDPLPVALLPYCDMRIEIITIIKNNDKTKFDECLNKEPYYFQPIGIYRDSTTSFNIQEPVYITIKANSRDIRCKIFNGILEVVNSE